MRNSQHPDQGTLFPDAAFPSRTIKRLDVERFRYRIKTGMAAALKPLDRDAVALAMSRDLGTGISRTMLDNYTAPSKDHEISLTRFKVLIRATAAWHLWDMAVSDDGLLVIEGDEARLAEIALLQQRQREIAAKLKTLRAVPVNVTRGI